MLYNPQKFKSVDTTEVFDLMDQNPFATVITITDGEPTISHLPITPKRIDDKIELLGHLARANPHWKSFSSSKATVIFHGPHTYITPKWYTENGVPTWNYSVAHISGKIELIESLDGLVECLKELTKHVERHWPSGWDFSIPDNLAGDILLKSIVGFKISVEEINFKRKMSQNRTPADQNGVLRGLATRSDDNSRAVLFEMKKLFSKGGE